VVVEVEQYETSSEEWKWKPHVSVSLWVRNMHVGHDDP